MKRLIATGGMGLLGLCFLSLPAAAHCDTLSGPVVSDARVALQKGNDTPVLKWVRPSDEAQLHDAFRKTLVVRRLGPEAKNLADTYFFETVVRLHRASEGAPYTGLKPAGTEDPIVRLADEALQTGTVERLANQVAGEVKKGFEQRFSHARQAKQHADESLAAGREYVKAYISFLHYAENLHLAAMGEEAQASGDHHER